MPSGAQSDLMPAQEIVRLLNCSDGQHAELNWCEEASGRLMDSCLNERASLCWIHHSCFYGVLGLAACSPQRVKDQDLHLAVKYSCPI